MIAVGLDGFKDGWVAVRIDGERSTVHFLDHVSEITELGADRAAIDIPIGMMDDGVRKCDLEARRLMGRHASRVFTGARRWLWHYADPDEANRTAERRGQSRVSRQLWHLGAKIVQVDEFLQVNRLLDIREAHPELVFLRLNEFRPLPSKKSARGVLLRMKLLKNKFPLNLEWIGDDHRGSIATMDDVLDACACAIAARDLSACVPEGNAPRDPKDLPMQIWY